jgi:hypothetical protein
VSGKPLPPNVNVILELLKICSSQPMSALPPKADMCGAARDVRFGPKADICSALAHVCFGPIADSCSAANLIDHLLGSSKQRRRKGEAECLCGLEMKKAEMDMIAAQLVPTRAYFTCHWSSYLINQKRSVRIQGLRAS